MSWTLPKASSTSPKDNYKDEKNLYRNLPINNQNNCVWVLGKKREVDENRLLVQTAKFAPHVMVSAGICLIGKGQLHFIPEKAKVNAKLRWGQRTNKQQKD